MRISQIATYIKRGITPAYVEENGLAVVNQKCIQKGQVVYDFIKYTDKDKRYTEEKKVCAGDVLINSTGAGTMGRVAYVEAGFTFSYVDSHVTILRCRDYNAKFLFYWLRTLERYIESLGKGATNQLELSADAIAGIEIPDIDVDKQNAVVAILSSYDNLIDNNHRQIVLLEEAAQRLYREWLVDLRFPGYENTKIVDSVPEGWEEKQLSDFADVVMGQSPKSEFYNREKRGLPFHQGVGGYGDRFVKDETYSTAYTRVAEAGSILFSVRAPVGRLNLTKHRVVIGRGLSAINHKDGLQSFLYYLLKGRFFKDNIIGNGSIFASINKEELLSQAFLIPTHDVVRKFDHISSAIDRRIDALDVQTKMLMEARDRLLPKLMSGEIAV